MRHPEATFVSQFVRLLWFIRVVVLLLLFCRVCCVVVDSFLFLMELLVLSLAVLLVSVLLMFLLLVLQSLSSL